MVRFKKTFFHACNNLFVVITFLLLSCNSENYYPKIKFKDISYDFKYIDYKKNVETIFVFYNSGGADLIISDIETSCGCTVAKWTKGKIAPGEFGEIKVVYDAERLGRFNKTIRVSYNGKKKYKTLEIKGFVLNPESSEAF